MLSVSKASSTSSDPRLPLLRGQVVSTHGRHYLVEVSSGEILTCFPRGKRSLVACGDLVQVVRTAAGQGVIEAVDPRRALLYRSDQYRQKLIAANVTQMVIVLAVVPSFYEELLNRCLAAAAHQRIPALIVLNKFDLSAESAPALASLAPYEQLGYTVLPLVAKHDVSPLRAHLTGHLSLLVGQSGMGKSTIINSLVPGAAAAVGESSGLIDSPGMQEFGLQHLSQRELADAFQEFHPYLAACRFNDCRHTGEPDCAVEAATYDGKVSARRLAAYRRIVADLKRVKPLKPRPTGRA
jgi:ribosome biogenesis GTPase